MNAQMRRHVADLLDRVDVAESIRRRAVQEALSGALAQTWERRADTFQWAAPRAGDFNGDATPDELGERSRRCEATAAACRRHAQLIREAPHESVSPEVQRALQEVA